MTEIDARRATPWARVIASYPQAYCALVNHPGRGYRVWDGAVNPQYSSQSPYLSGWHPTARKAWAEAGELIETGGPR